MSTQSATRANWVGTSVKQVGISSHDLENNIVTQHMFEMSEEETNCKYKVIL